MKLLSLNIWAGTQGQPLFDYLKSQAEHTDIFCFQEVFRTAEKIQPPKAAGRMFIFQELQELLPNYTPLFALTSKNHDLEKVVDFQVEAGMAMFVKNNLEILAEDQTPIFGTRGDSIDPTSANIPTVLQRVELRTAGKIVNVCNYHGTAYPGDKLDTPQRLEQAQKINRILSGLTGSKILCGDFNLTANIESIKILEQGMRNLISEFNITNTRNEISWNKYQNKQHFADFTFVSPEVKVQSFEVPYNTVSDHLPMILDFSL